MNVKSERPESPNLALDPGRNGLWFSLHNIEKSVPRNIKQTNKQTHLGNCNLLDPLLNNFIQLSQDVTPRKQRYRQREMERKRKTER